MRLLHVGIFAFGGGLIGLAWPCVADPAPLPRWEDALRAPATHVGTAVCASCHAEIFARWAETPHGRVADVSRLGQAGSNDPSCRACHGTGASFEPAEREPFVGCEACHGGGAAYATRDLMANPGLARELGLRDLPRMLDMVCGACHRPESAPGAAPFDAAAAWERVRH